MHGFNLYHPDITSISEHENENSIKIYPNPLRDELIIETDIINYRIDISDSLGRIILKVHSDKKDHKIHTSTLSKGIYFIKIFDIENNLLMVQQIIKEWIIWLQPRVDELAGNRIFAE